MFSKRWLLIILAFLTLLTRFIKPDWGQGFFFHPDENNMAIAMAQLGKDGLNPHFFAYGQFPLYLGYFSLKILHLPITFSACIFVLRFYSGLFASFSVLVFYFISRRVFNSTVAAFAAILFIFTPGLIQVAHFGTTESLLILVFLLNIFFSLNLLRSPAGLASYFLTALITGIGMGSKISSLIFLTPFLLVSTYNFFRSSDKLKIVFYSVYTVLFTFLFFIIFSPYNLISHSDFLSAFAYEAGVAKGTIPVFYTSQFLHTTPFIFQITHIFPYVLGIPIFITGIIGLFYVLKNKLMFVVAISSLVYFLYFGSLYVKWTRFMSPLFFLFPLLSALVVTKLKSPTLRLILVFICLIPGAMYLRIYLTADIRLSASEWLVSNLPTGSKVLSEGGNVVDIPVVPHELKIVNFDFYTLENNPQNISALVSGIESADFILVPSRRVFSNHNNPDFPVSQRYYQNLFQGGLGFLEIKTLSPIPDFILDSEKAEETWSVFDRPVIRVFKKVSQFSLEEYEQILKV